MCRRQHTMTVHPSLKEFCQYHGVEQYIQILLVYCPQLLVVLPELRDYNPSTTPPRVVNAYFQMHQQQTYDFVQAIFVCTVLLHDIGKILLNWDEPSWCVVGDTFPVGCEFQRDAIDPFPEFFNYNSDSWNPLYDKYGVYEEHCGLDNVVLSWGHDEYLYLILCANMTRIIKAGGKGLTDRELWPIRYHSCYPIHDLDTYINGRSQYDHLLTGQDYEMLGYVREFNHYDLYSKVNERPDVAAVLPSLLAEYIAPFIPLDLSLNC